MKIAQACTHENPQSNKYGESCILRKENTLHVSHGMCAMNFSRDN